MTWQREITKATRLMEPFNQAISHKANVMLARVKVNSKYSSTI